MIWTISCLIINYSCPNSVYRSGYSISYNYLFWWVILYSIASYDNTSIHFLNIRLPNSVTWVNYWEIGEQNNIKQGKTHPPNINNTPGKVVSLARYFQYKKTNQNNELLSKIFSNKKYHFIKTFSNRNNEHLKVCVCVCVCDIDRNINSKGIQNNQIYYLTTSY